MARVFDTPSNACLIIAGEVDILVSMSEITELPDGPADSDGLRPRQRKVLEFIHESMATRGYPPSMREIGEAVGLVSTSSVSHQLHNLERMGYIRRDPSRPRAMQVVIPGSSVVSAAQETVIDETDSGNLRPEAAFVPLVGRIAAGGPILAEQQVEDVFPMPRSIVGDGELFILEVRGDSMIDAAICEGDYVVVRRQPSAENGQIVAALLDTEATVKVFQQKGGQTWLLPRNPHYTPIDGNHAQILGIVTAVMRRVGR